MSQLVIISYVKSLAYQILNGE